MGFGMCRDKCCKFWREPLWIQFHVVVTSVNKTNVLDFTTLFWVNVAGI